MRAILLCLILVAPLCHSSDEQLDSIVLKLASEDFDEREQITNDLSNYEPGYIPLLLKLSDGWHDVPEIAWRLQRAAKGIFDHKVLKQDERYQLLYGGSGINWEVEWCGWQRARQMMRHNPDDGPEPQKEEIDIDYVTVTGVYGDSPAAECIQQDDKITEINGHPVRGLINGPNFKYGLFEPNKDYTVKLKRVICNKDEQGNVLSYNEKEFEVKFKSNKKQDKEVDQNEIYELEKELWENYLVNYKATHSY